MLKRSTFRRPTLERTRTVHVPVPEHLRRKARMAPVDGIPASAIEKENPVSCEAYRRLVAALPCMNCRINDNSQAAHPNTNKAKGMKADDRLCFPLCAVRFNAPGCHYLFDQHQLFPRSQRAAVEQQWGAETRAAIVAAGLWPKTLPLWIEA
jgi:hypothetical protein